MFYFGNTKGSLKVNLFFFLVQLTIIYHTNIIVKLWFMLQDHG